MGVISGRQVVRISAPIYQRQQPREHLTRPVIAHHMSRLISPGAAIAFYEGILHCPSLKVKPSITILQIRQPTRAVSYPCGTT